MPLLLFLMLQDPDAVDPERYGMLRGGLIGRACPRGDDGEIVVCGKADEEGFRLRPVAPTYGPPASPPRLAARIGKASIDTDTQERFDQPALLFNVRVPF